MPWLLSWNCPKLLVGDLHITRIIPVVNLDEKVCFTKNRLSFRTKTNGDIKFNPSQTYKKKKKREITSLDLSIIRRWRCALELFEQGPALHAIILTGSRSLVKWNALTLKQQCWYSSKTDVIIWRTVYPGKRYKSAHAHDKANSVNSSAFAKCEQAG